MKVKIKKEGKKKTYKFIDSWSDVNLDKWIKLIDLRTKSKTEEAGETIALLSDIPKKLVKELPLKDVAVLMGKVAEMQSKQDNKLAKVFEIEGVEYGMHPDLNALTLGEYADLETFIKDGLEKNMPECMAVLFRPIIEKKNKAYTIEAYDGNINVRAEIMKKMPAGQVQNALVFFYHLGKVLLKTLPLCFKERADKMMKEYQIQDLLKNGVGSV